MKTHWITPGEALEMFPPSSPAALYAKHLREYGLQCYDRAMLEACGVTIGMDFAKEESRTAICMRSRYGEIHVISAFERVRRWGADSIGMFAALTTVEEQIMRTGRIGQLLGFRYIEAPRPWSLDRETMRAARAVHRKRWLDSLRRAKGGY